MKQRIERRRPKGVCFPMTTGLQVMMTRFTERLQERLNRANATPNDLPREGEKNVSFSICLLVVNVCHLDANSLIIPGDENAG